MLLCVATHLKTSYPPTAFAYIDKVFVVAPPYTLATFDIKCQPSPPFALYPVDPVVVTKRVLIEP